MRAVPWVLLALALGGGAYLFLGDSGAPRNDFDESGHQSRLP